MAHLRIFFKWLFIYLFTFGCAGSSLLGFSLVAMHSFLVQWLLLLESMGYWQGGFLVVAHGLNSCNLQVLEHQLSSCGARAQLLRGMWDLPGSGIEPMSPALAGGFFTTEPPGKPLKLILRGSQKQGKRSSQSKAHISGWAHKFQIYYRNSIAFLVAQNSYELSMKISVKFHQLWASLVAQLVKNLSAMQEIWVCSLGWEDPLEKGKAIHSSLLAWRIPWTVQSMGTQRVGHD